MDKQSIIKRFVVYAIEDLYLAFVLGFQWSYQRTFFLEQGLEKVCKAYILGHKSAEYNNLTDEDAERKIQDICKNYGHNLTKMIDEINEASGNNIKSLVDVNYDGFNGAEIIKVLFPDMFEESRYPVSKPVAKKFSDKECQGINHDPIYSSGPSKFVYAVTNAIIGLINTRFTMNIDEVCIKEIVSKKIDYNHNIVDRFCNIFLKS